jgi:hypothetical protein
MSADFYPPLHIGDDIEFATNPSPASQWRLGRVACCKTLSCDLIVYTANGAEPHHDCFHVDDPRCKIPREWIEQGRGVFRLAKCELDKRQFQADMPAFREQFDQVQKAIERATIVNTKSRQTAGV